MKKVQNSPKENFQETNQNSWVGQCDNRNKDCNDMVRKKKVENIPESKTKKWRRKIQD